MNYKPLPASQAFLERYRLQARKCARPDMVGAHLALKSGQSLEFKELVSYCPGFDIRRVDWKSSARAADYRGWLAKEYVAEQLRRMVVSIDAGETMRLPDNAPKLLMACWLAEALAWIALRGEWRVCIHRLFGSPKNSFVEFKAMREAGNIHGVLENMIRDGEPESGRATTPKTDTEIPRSLLPPASVWIVITDLYFEDNASTRALAAKMASARHGSRWVLLVDMDAWPCEKAVLGTGPRRIEGPGVSEPAPEYEIAPEGIETVRRRIDSHKAGFLKKTGPCDVASWKWEPDIEKDPGRFFREKLIQDKVIRRLFMKESWQ